MRDGNSSCKGLRLASVSAISISIKRLRAGPSEVVVKQRSEMPETRSREAPSEILGFLRAIRTDKSA